MKLRSALLVGVLAASGVPAIGIAQTAQTPDRGVALLQLQLNTRRTQPPPRSMEGARASEIYRRFTGSDGRAPPNGGVAPPSTATRP